MYDSAMDRREYGRIGLPAIGFAVDEDGNELGMIKEISGGGMLLDPASPFARLHLTGGQQLQITIVEPGSGHRTEVNIEVRYIHGKSIGTRFL